jgi:hypothetical protein
MRAMNEHHHRESKSVTTTDPSTDELFARPTFQAATTTDAAELWTWGQIASRSAFTSLIPAHAPVPPTTDERVDGRARAVYRTRRDAAV